MTLIGSTLSDPAASAIDVAGWRERIRRDTFSGYHYEMGVAIEATGDAAAAAAAYRRALATEPNHFEAWLRLEELLRAQGDGAGADDIDRQALARNPDYRAVACARIAQALLDRDGPAEQAIARYRQALDSKPDFAEAEYRLGLLLRGLGRLSEADQRMGHACGRDPALVALGLALLRSAADWNSAVETLAEGKRVVTAPSLWSMAAMANLAMPPDTPGRAVVRVRMTVESGLIGVGLFRREVFQTTFPEPRLLDHNGHAMEAGHAPTDAPIVIELPANAKDIGWLLVRNWQAGDATSQVVVHSLDVLPVE